MLFKDKVVIIAGYGPGLGHDMAVIAAKEGARVAIGARSEDNLKAGAKEISDAGGEIMWKRTDISNNDDCLALVAAVVEKWGGVDACINNAMAGNADMIEGVNMDVWRKVFDVNLFGTMQMAQACIEPMKAKGEGYIVNVSSMAHRKPLPPLAAYSASKAGMEGATRYLAKELGQIRHPGEHGADGLYRRADGGPDYRRLGCGAGQVGSRSRAVDRQRHFDRQDSSRPRLRARRADARLAVGCGDLGRDPRHQRRRCDAVTRSS